jgi:predicted TIM-barrel fold metal-dependent hydrolase
VIIDADTHVLETEKTFDYFSEVDKKYKPSVVTVVGEAVNSGVPNSAHGSDFWLIDGQLYGKHNLSRIEAASNGEIVTGTLDISNTQVRLAAMDQQGVDVAVIYPSIFLVTAIENPDAEFALAKSYNRWLADICSTAPDRFKFAMLVSPRRLEESIAEMKWAKNHGACGVMLRGFEGEQTPDQADFFPLFAKASELDLPICIHIGHGSKAYRSIKMGGTQRLDPFAIRVPTLISFSALLRSDIHKKFPDLRWAYVEAGSSWLPFLSVMSMRTRNDDDKAGAARTAIIQRNIYITCEEHEDLPTILQYSGDNNLVIGSDFGHPGDVADSIHVQNVFRGRADISDPIKQKILSDNARKLYGL